MSDITAGRRYYEYTKLIDQLYRVSRARPAEQRVGRVRGPLAQQVHEAALGLRAHYVKSMTS